MNAVEAVATAKRHVSELFDGDALGEPSLEAVVPSGGTWEIALSFQRARPLRAGGLGLAMNPDLVNYRKVVRVDRETGELVSVTDPE